MASPLIRPGGKTSCPTHGTNPGAGGGSSPIIGGKTACGTTLIAGQQTTIDHL